MTALRQCATYPRGPMRSIQKPQMGPEMYMPRFPASPRMFSCVLERCSVSCSCGAYELNAYVLPADSAMSTEPSSETRRRPCDMAVRLRKRPRACGAAHPPARCPLRRPRRVSSAWALGVQSAYTRLCPKQTHTRRSLCSFATQMSRSSSCPSSGRASSTSGASAIPCSQACRTRSAVAAWALHSWSSSACCGAWVRRFLTQSPGAMRWSRR